MDKKIKKKWVAALRSGKYRRGTGHLCAYDKTSKKNKYCCLGVLCDIHAKATGNEFVKDSSRIREYLDESDFLPLEVQEWANLKANGGSLKKKVKGHTNLVSLNDSGDANFKEIADAIEKYL